MIEKFDADIACLCETWLTKADTINADGYRWIGPNRSKLVKSAVRGSGRWSRNVSERELIQEVQHQCY